MTLLTASLILIGISIYYLLFETEIIIYGDNNKSSMDDKVCITIGSDLTDNKAHICCNSYRTLKTTNINTNFSYDTTECLKIDNIRYD